MTEEEKEELCNAWILLAPEMRLRMISRYLQIMRPEQGQDGWLRFLGDQFSEMWII